MGWGETFVRTARALWVILAVSVFGGMALAIGATNFLQSVIDGGEARFLAGVAWSLAGIFIMALGFIAALTKVVADAAADAASPLPPEPMSMLFRGSPNADPPVVEPGSRAERRSRRDRPGRS